jgi:hypothetical protein
MREGEVSASTRTGVKIVDVPHLSLAVDHVLSAPFADVKHPKNAE